MRAEVVIKTLFLQMLAAVFITQAWAACINPPVSAEAISRFKAAPQALVDPNSDTRTVEASVRDLAGTEASLAADLVRVAQGTTPRFQTAIAAGLAQAAIACSTIDQHAALLIQQAVAGFEDGQFQASFAAVAGDLSTAATAAAVSSATSSVGSVIVVNPNTAPGLKTAPGRGGSIGPVQFISPTITVLTRSNTTPTAASTVSPTR
jgi:hypothetical protein